MNHYNSHSTNTPSVDHEDQSETDSETEELIVEAEVEYNSDDYDIDI